MEAIIAAHSTRLTLACWDTAIEVLRHFDGDPVIATLAINHMIGYGLSAVDADHLVSLVAILTKEER